MKARSFVKSIPATQERWNRGAEAMYGEHLVGISSIARDITERKRIEATARERWRYARSLIEASLDRLGCYRPAPWPGEARR